MVMGEIALYLLVIVVFIGFHTMVNVKSRNKDTAYYILASNMLDKHGELIEIDTDGKLVNKKSLKMQDLIKFNFNQDKFIAGGERANNNIILHGDGDYKLFSLLDNPNYSGVTSINLCDEKIVAVMNGNVEEDIWGSKIIKVDLYSPLNRSQLVDDLRISHSSGNFDKIFSIPWGHQRYIMDRCEGDLNIVFSFFSQ